MMCHMLQAPAHRTSTYLSSLTTPWRMTCASYAQALEAAGAEVLKQLTNDSMSSTQLQHGLDLLLHLEAYWPPGIMPAEQSVTHHLRSFLQAKVSISLG